MSLNSKEREALEKAKTRTKDPQGFGGNADSLQGEPSSCTFATEPQMPAGQTEAAMIMQAANSGFEVITRLDSIMSQATSKVAAASEQLAIQAADQDAYVLGGGHYLNTYFRRLNAHQAANKAYQDELSFQARIDQAMARRAQLPQANQVVTELNLLPGA